MLCCLNPSCPNPQNPNGTNFCLNCGTELVPLLRGRYRVMELLGGGGFGRTYLAEDLDKLNEQCVVKQLAPQVQGSRAIQKATEWFPQEAMRLQQLGKHSQIPTLYAYFQVGNYLYLVQELVVGQNLLQELKHQGAFTDLKIRELLNDLLPVLQVVHEQRVIHRDIKPENLMRRQSDGKLVLIDFGVAKQVMATAIARTGTIVGSFGYAPIEQMQEGEVYPASDLYSLGATCFHLLTQIPPWQLWQVQGYSWVCDWRKHLKTPVSQKLGLILDKLLLQNHEQRYQSAQEVLEDLNTKTVTTQPSSSSGALKVTSPRKPKFKKIWLMSGVLLLGLLGTQLYGYFEYKLSPFNQLFLITSLHSRSLLKNLLTVAPDWVSSLAISPDGQTLVSGNADNTIKIWNLQTRELKNTLTGHTYPVNSLVISPDRQTLVSGSHDGKIRLWNLNTGKLKNTLTGHTYPVNSLAISLDGQTLVSGSTDNTIKIWDFKTGVLKNTLNEHSDLINSLAISSDAQTLVSGSADNSIKIWHLETGELKNTLVGHTASVNSLAISSDAQTLVSGSADNSIKIWHLETGELKNTFVGHTAAVNSLAISSDAQTLVSGSADNFIKIWHLQTGELKHTLIEHTHTVYLVAVSPDGQTLVSGSYDGKIKTWQLP